MIHTPSERIAIESYGEMVRYFGNDDRRRAGSWKASSPVEEEHARRTWRTL